MTGVLDRAGGLHATGRRLGARVVAALVLGLVCAGSALAQASSEDWRKGVSLFEQGRFDEALDLLDRYIAANPSNEEALRARDEAGYQVFVQMLKRNDDIATIARKVLELAERGEQFDEPDRDRILDLIRRLMSDEEYEVRYRAQNELVSQIGPFCVPYMVEHLADRRNDDKRVKAIVTLSRLGPDGTNAVIELLYHPDNFVRENACHILGHIRDIKAVPYLKAMSERKEESSQVTKAAREALANVTGKDAGSLASALDLFEALGERYYQEHPTVMINNFRRWAVWDWREDRLRFRLVPSYAWNDEMAENVLYDALDHARRTGASDAQLDGVYTLLVSTHFQQVVEVEGLHEVAEIKAGLADIDEEQFAELKEARARLGNLKALSAARGEAHVAKALRKALLDRRVPLAVALIEQLRDMDMSEGMLPASGANLAAYLEGDAKAAPAGLSVERRRAPEASSSSSDARSSAEPMRRSEPTPTPAPARQPEPARQPDPAPAAEPAPEPAPEQPAPRRRRISQGDALDGPAYAEVYGPQAQRTLQSGGDAHGAALAAALTYEDKRVRYAAAEALLRLAPSKAFAASDKVWEGLAGALGESGSRVVLIAAYDQQVRNRMAGLVRGLNHVAFSVSTAKEAVVRARGSATQDVLLVHSRFPDGDLSTAQVLEEVARDYRTKGLPIVILAPRFDVQKKREQFPNAAAVIPDDVDPVVLRDQLQTLWTGDFSRPNDPKRKATDVARRAALAIAEADPRTSVFDLDKTIPALLEAIEYQPDEVRIPALRALGVLGTAQSVDKASIIFDNPKNGREVRIAAAQCLGGALRGQACPPKVFESFLRGMRSGDRALYRACGEAFGKMRLTRDQSLELFETQRVE